MSRSPWTGVAIVALAVIQQALGHVNCDTSWFMTFAEKVLAGAVPYVDVSDPNPPSAFLADVPSLLVARALHVAPEGVLEALTFAGALLSIVAAGFILRGSNLLRRDEAVAAFNLASFVLLVVPAFCFAEREHFAIVLLLPFLALCAARADGAGPASSVAITAGLAAGLALTFKPYYLLPPGLAVLCVAARRRSWRCLLAPELAAAAVVGGLYVLAIAWFFPAFLSDVLPLAAEVYLPVREALSTVLSVPAFLVNVGLLFGILAVGGGRERDPLVLVPCAASTGFLATYLIQSKGWINHAYPGVALALLAGAFVLFARREKAADRRRGFALFVFLPMLVAAPLVFGARADLLDEEEFPGLTAEVERLAPAHPTLAALAEEADVGHPLVRRLGGRWVGRQNSLWISNAVEYLLDRDGRDIDAPHRARLLALKERDETIFAKDVERERPDVLLVETPALEKWARREPALRGLFDPYRLAGHAGAVTVWLRQRG